MSEESRDPITEALLDLEQELGAIADVDRERLESGIVRVEVTPRNSNALSIVWTFLGDEIVVEAGRHGGRWELSRTPRDVDFMKRVVRSIAAGRVRETFGPRRSSVEVTLEDGTTIAETGYASPMPRPGWRRKGPTVSYESYTG